MVRWRCLGDALVAPWWCPGVSTAELRQIIARAPTGHHLGTTWAPPGLLDGAFLSLLSLSLSVSVPVSLSLSLIFYQGREREIEREREREKRETKSKRTDPCGEKGMRLYIGFRGRALPHLSRLRRAVR